MGYSVEWSPEAKIAYTDILEYLKGDWPFEVLENFVYRTDQVIGFISLNPLQYPYFESKNVHKCVVVKQVSLFYRVKADKVEILTFWDNRRDPAKIQSFINKIK